MTSTAALLDQLKSQYEVLCFFDLAEVAKKHSRVFEIFQEHRRETYTDRQRLVFYTSHLPSQKLLDHLQRAAAKVDISNFFIMICCSHDIGDLVKKSNDTYGHDDVCISCHTVELAATDPINDQAIVPYQSMCVAPFSFFRIGYTDNRYSPCCKYNGKISDIHTVSIKDAFYSSDMEQLRDRIRKGELPQQCQDCQVVEKHGGTSLRKHLLTKADIQADLSWFDDVHIRMMDLVPSTMCNFKCRVCNPYTSSQVTAEELRYADSPQKKKIFSQLLTKGKWTELDRFRKELSQVSQHLISLHFLGGEPTLMDNRLDEVLNDLVASKRAQNMSVSFSTNGSIWNEKFLKSLDQFQSSEILLSIDNIGKRFEIERGGSWEDVELNIRKFLQRRDERSLVKILCTINVQNVLYLDQLTDFADALGIDIIWSHLEKPRFLCVDRMTQAAKDLVIEKYLGHKISDLASLPQRMQNTPPVDGTEFVEYMSKLDQRRGQDSMSTHGEIISAMQKK